MKKIPASCVLIILFAIIAVSLYAIATANVGSQITNPKFRAWTTSGAPLVGGLLWTYESGTSTPKSTYTTRQLTTANSNPIVLDSNGEATVWGLGSYKMVLETKPAPGNTHGTTIWTMDPVIASGTLDGNNTANIEDYGAVCDGVTDDSAAITNAIAALSEGGVLRLHDATCLIDNPLTITNGINIRGDSATGTKLKAGPNMTGKAMIIYEPSSSARDLKVFENLYLDADNKATYGLHVKGGNLFTVKQMSINNATEAGIFVDGNAYGDINELYSFQQTYQQINSAGSKYGFKIVRGVSGSGTFVFDNFNFENCIAYANDDAGVYVDGGNASGSYNNLNVRFNGVIDNTLDTATAFFIVKNGAYLVLDNVRIEGPTGRGDTVQYAVVTKESRVDIFGGDFYSHPIPTVDSNSTVCCYGCYQNFVFMPGNKRALTNYCMGDRISDKLRTGSPNYPDDDNQSRGSGFAALKGTRSIDSMGTEWVNTATSTSGTTRWVPHNGRVIVPIDYNTLNNYRIPNELMFWAEEDFLLKEVYLVVKDAFKATLGSTTCDPYGTSAQHTMPHIAIGTVAKRNKFIDAGQGNETYLVENAIIKATSNDNSSLEAVLSDNASYLMRGLTWYPHADGTEIGGYGNSSHERTYMFLDSCPSHSDDGNWTAGSGWIVIEGVPLKYN